MKILNETQYLEMREGAEVTASDHHGDKVLRLTDGTYLKLFRIKRLFTSAWLFPYWRRFERNAHKLTGLGVPTLRVKEVFKVSYLARTAVHYDPLPGNMLREESVDEALVSKLGCFIRSLHDKGVYLRSLHLGNVILTPEGELGLIDFADMRVLRKPLSRGMRFRNFHHLCRYTDDRALVNRYIEAFLPAFDERDRSKIRQMFQD